VGVVYASCRNRCTRYHHPSSAHRSDFVIYGSDAHNLHIQKYPPCVNILGVVPLIDTFWDQPGGYAGHDSFRILVMPLFTGSIAEPRFGRLCQVALSYDDIVLFLENLLECLIVLHNERHIVHLDIKPSNILVDFDSTNNRISGFYLSDFGLAHVRYICIICQNTLDFIKSKVDPIHQTNFFPFSFFPLSYGLHRGLVRKCGRP